MSYNPLPQPATSVVLTGPSTSPVSFSNPFPVSLGSSSITIIGDITIPGIVTVTSTPENPIHSHIVKVGTSGTLTTPYLPIGISTLLNTVSIGNTVSISNTAFYVTSIGSTVNIQGTVGIGTTGQVSINVNGVGVSSTNPFPVTGTLGISSTSVVSVTLPPTATDAFGRQRVSNPLTLFDSSHRYRDNNLWSSLIVGAGSTVGFVTTQGLINIGIGTTAGCSVIRETTKVFAYQPGKSLKVLNTFVFNSKKQNLRQRVGYYGADNGMYLELDGNTLYFVERTLVSGITTENRKQQSEWNVDTLLGPSSGYLNLSGITLDISKAQILWMDIEWLGLGTVRMGFVIDGKFIHCHSFHHANRIETTYITTASLPLRYEIANTGITTSSSTLKQVCSSVISEGGYELRGLQQAVSVGIGTPVDLTTSGTYYTVLSIRLKTSPNRLDAIVILTALSILGITNNANYNWRIVASGISTGGSWISAGDDSAVEYKIDGGTHSGGRVLASGFINGSNQGSTPVDILKEALFKFQLERDGLTGTPYELTLIAASDTNGADIYAAMDWEEVSR